MRILAFNSICLIAIFGIASAQNKLFPAAFLYARLDYTNECTRITKMLDASCYNVYNMLRTAYQYYMNPLFHARARFNAAYADLIAQSGLDAETLSSFTDYVTNNIDSPFVIFEQTIPSFEEQVLMGISPYITYGGSMGCGGTQCSYAIGQIMQSSYFFTALTIYTYSETGMHLSDDCKAYVIHKFLEVIKDRAAKILMIIIERMGEMPNTAAAVSDLISEIIEILDDLTARMNACANNADLIQLISFVASCQTNCINNLLDQLGSDMPMAVQQDVSDTMTEITGKIGWIDYYITFASFCPQEP